MAEEYLSRRILDSLTMKSAKSRTLSASEADFASFMANARNLSIAPEQNWSAVCVTTTCFVTVAADEADKGAVPGVDMLSLDWELEADRVCGGGVGSAFGTIDESSADDPDLRGRGENGGVAAPAS